MKSSLVISNFETGFETDREPFIINNDAFPTLNNAYLWRGKCYRKRGNSFLGRLEITLTAQALGTTTGGGAFSVNILTFLGILAITSDATIAPGSITITVGGTTFTEPVPANGTLVGSPSGTGTINYVTGALTLTGAPALTAVTITFGYFPDLPVLGLESFDTGTTNLPRLVAFDNLYSYEIAQPSYIFHNVNFYKATGTPFLWSGGVTNQFWTINYAGALWATNGTPGFHFQTISSIVTGATTTINTATDHGLITGDYVFFNEIVGTNATAINLMTAIVTVTSTTQFTVPITTTGALTGGIFQTLTADGGGTSFGDGIKWYDGDPTLTANAKGWVNFAPPLSNSPTPTYLIGAKMILPFKNRLLFFGVYVATSAGAITFFGNRVEYSWDGTPYYASLVPSGQVSDARAWFTNVAGFGGFISAPITQNIVTVTENEDVVLMGMERRHLKLIFTGDDSFPFIIQTITAELGSQNTFSGISLDTGALTIGEYGLALTTQQSSQRVDLKIPDQIFDIAKANGASAQVTAYRDFRYEFIYFTYIPTDSNNTFPCKTLVYNYRENSWATFDENYTHYGTFRKTGNTTWATLGEEYGTWAEWNDPWNFGSTIADYPLVIGGNQQGFVMIKNAGTFEDNSQYIQSIDPTGVNGPIIVSPSHGLLNNDFIIINNAIGMSNMNGIIFQIQVDDLDTFHLILTQDQLLAPPLGTYLGGGVYLRLSRPNIMTKQFPIFWEGGRQARIGTQRYLLQTTEFGAITINIFVSQNDTDPANDPISSTYLPFTNIVLTSPENNNAFTQAQNQIWHRMSNSFNGDTVQIGITLSDEQMFDQTMNSAEIILHAIVMELYPGPILS